VRCAVLLKLAKQCVNPWRGFCAFRLYWTIDLLRREAWRRKQGKRERGHSRWQTASSPHFVPPGILGFRQR